jgi:thymidylate synthase (FAD)
MVEPKVFKIAETTITNEIHDYLQHIGAIDWWSDPESDAGMVIEVMGRSCYKSFGTELNANITRVREGNKEYINNILKVRHGSVLEHASVSFMFCDVSRVFTHELVRHRVGTAMSQESLRFVRLTDLKYWAPSVIRENEKAMELFEASMHELEDMQRDFAELMITEDMPFSEKKIITSAMRRVAPMGLATNIGWTANIRTLRWLLDLRTAPSAEEEIRLVFGKVGEVMMRDYPYLFQDFNTEEKDGLLHYYPKYDKV